MMMSFHWACVCQSNSSNCFPLEWWNTVNKPTRSYFLQCAISGIFVISLKSPDSWHSVGRATSRNRRNVWFDGSSSWNLVSHNRIAAYAVNLLSLTSIQTSTYPKSSFLLAEWRDAKATSANFWSSFSRWRAWNRTTSPVKCSCGDTAES